MKTKKKKESVLTRHMKVTDAGKALEAALKGDTHQPVFLPEQAIEKARITYSEPSDALSYPGHIQAQLDMAIALLPNGSYDTALDAFENVLKLDDQNDQAHYYRAVALEKLNRKEEAMDIFKMLAADPSGKFAQKAQQYIDDQEIPDEV